MTGQDGNIYADDNGNGNKNNKNGALKDMDESEQMMAIGSSFGSANMQKFGMNNKLGHQQSSSFFAGEIQNQSVAKQNDSKAQADINNNRQSAYASGVAKAHYFEQSPIKNDKASSNVYYNPKGLVVKRQDLESIDFDKETQSLFDIII